MALVLRALLVWALFVASEASAEEDVFAKINGKVLTRADVESAVYAVARQRFYHGRVDDERLEALRAEVVGRLVDQILLVEEAGRQGIKPGAQEAEQLFERLRRGYNGAAMSKEQRQRVETELRQQAEQRLMVEKLEAKVKAAGEPSAEVLRGFYQANLAKFTTPPRLHLSVILLKVAPSAPSQSWQAAENEAQQLYRKLQEGADFAELARLHSGDASADGGGDLGFVHQGMLADEAQAAVDGLSVGQVSAPVLMLQGVALFRLEARQEAKVNPFEQVRERALGLWQRERADSSWQALLLALRAKARIEMVGADTSAAMLWKHEAVIRQ